MSRDSEVVYQAGGKEQKMKVQYIGGLFTGTLGIIDFPDENQMGIYSKAVYNNIPYIKEKEMVAEIPAGNPVPGK